MEVMQVKGLAAFAIWIVALLGGLLPFYLKQRHQPKSGNTGKTDGATRSGHNDTDEVPNLSPNTLASSTPIASATSSLLSPPPAHQQAMTSSDDHDATYTPLNDGYDHSSNSSKYGATSSHHHGHEDEYDERHGHAHSTPKRRGMNVDRFLSLGNMAGAGIFLGGGLMHLLPESSQGLLEAQAHWGTYAEFPLAYLLCGLGFFTILLVEEVTIAMTTRKGKAPTRKSSTASTSGRGEDTLTRQVELPIKLAGDETAKLVAVPLVRKLQRHLVQGMTPRLALVPAPKRHHHHKEEVPNGLDAEHAAVVLVSQRCDADDCSDSDACSSDDEGDSSGSNESHAPIQAFLDHNAECDSPAPFPSLSERRRRKLRRASTVSGRATQSRSRTRARSSGPSASSDDELQANGTGRHASASASTTQRATKNGEARRAVSPHAVETDLLVQPTSHASQPLLSAQHAVDSSASPSGGATPQEQQAFVLALSQAAGVVGNEVTSIRIVSPSPASAKNKKDRTSRRSSNNASATLVPAPIAVLQLPVVSTDHTHINGTAADHSHAHGEADSHGHGHGHGGEDGHSHMSFGADTSYIVALLLVMALSVHSIFEGIALGTQGKMSTTVSIFIAIIAHTPLAGFALGVSLVKSRAGLKMALSCLVLFTIMTPLGTILGIVLSYTLDGDRLKTISCIFQAFSAGTFLFVALEEIIPKELATPKDKPQKLALAVTGFLLMASIKLFDAD